MKHLSNLRQGTLSQMHVGPTCAVCGPDISREETSPGLLCCAPAKRSICRRVGEAADLPHFGRLPSGPAGERKRGPSRASWGVCRGSPAGPLSLRPQSPSRRFGTAFLFLSFPFLLENNDNDDKNPIKTPFLFLPKKKGGGKRNSPSLRFARDISHSSTQRQSPFRDR